VLGCGQAIIENDIHEHGVNRVVVGACAPFLHERTFRGTVARAGLNPYLYHHVGLREQDSAGCTARNPDGATSKAIRLMMAGIAKARLLDPLEPSGWRPQARAGHRRRRGRPARCVGHRPARHPRDADREVAVPGRAHGAA
jgi:hypothetical protein